MALYQYVKSEPRVVIAPETRKKVKKGISFLLSVFGLILVGNAMVPIINYQLRYAPRFSKVLSPLVYDHGTVLASLAASAKEEERDYTLISSWFEEKPDLKPIALPEVNHYWLTIPRLGIDQALVQVGGEDLKKMLIHYPNTAFPGQLGNTVIFGHSVLPQFFNPKNYLTIFSTLYQLREGDEILVDFDGVEYRYLVEDLFEVSSEDLSVLEQRYDGRFLTLITCSPPGTYLRRLIVRARLIDQ